MLIGTYNAQYIGKAMCGFESGQDYCIEIDKDVYGYKISGITNLTKDSDTSNAYITYASENSLRRYWTIGEDVTCLKK